jgi:phenylpropionate dioxygenase-like ring-hydroxylating dioxygenase large terminal subunit
VHVVGNEHPGLLRFWHPVALVGTPEAVGPYRLLGEDWKRSEVANIVEHLGLVWIAPEHALAPLPHVDDDADDAFVRVPSAPADWHAGAAQMADNFCDIGHLPFVHATSFADPDDTFVPALHVERADTGFTMVYEHSTRRLHTDGVGPRVFRLAVTAPFAVVLRLEYPEEDAVITSAFLHQPLDAATTRLWAINWRNDILDGRCTARETTAFQELVGAEDRAMLEQLVGHELPLDLHAEVHTRADRPTVELRRMRARVIPPPPAAPVAARLAVRGLRRRVY